MTREKDGPDPKVYDDIARCSPERLAEAGAVVGDAKWLADFLATRSDEWRRSGGWHQRREMVRRWREDAKGRLARVRTQQVVLDRLAEALGRLAFRHGELAGQVEEALARWDREALDSAIDAYVAGGRSKATFGGEGGRGGKV